MSRYSGSDEKTPLRLKRVDSNDDEATDFLKQNSIQSRVKQESHGTYGSFVAYCFCVNYILGVGVLGVPYVSIIYDKNK